MKVPNENKIFEENKHLCEYVMYKKYKRYTDKEELKSFTQLGLLQSIRTYDKTKGHDFKRHAINNIIFYTSNQIKKYDPNPENNITDSRIVYKTQEYLRQKNLKNYDELEALQYSGIKRKNPKQVINTTLFKSKPKSLNVKEYINSITTEEKINTIKDPKSNLENQIEYLELQQIIQKIIKTFNKEDQYLIKQKFFKERTYTDIAKELKCSRSNISMRMMVIMQEIRLQLVENQWSEYYEIENYERKRRKKKEKHNV